MAISPDGTFEYVATVPESCADGSFECVARLREPIDSIGDRRFVTRLVGHAPVVRVADAGLTPDARTKAGRPWVLRSSVTLTASAREHAAVAAASFHVDKGLMANCRPGDVLHVARTGRGGLGLSISRDGRLVAAVGAITAVPLGAGVTAVLPRDRIATAEAAFRQVDPEFHFPELPIEISVDGSVAVIYKARRTLGEYAVFTVHGVLHGIPGTAECAAISRTRWCPDIVANTSAMLLDGDGDLSLVRWPNRPQNNTQSDRQKQNRRG